MHDSDRRKFLELPPASAAAAALGAGARLDAAGARADARLQARDGAKLRMLRSCASCSPTRKCAAPTPRTSPRRPASRCASTSSAGRTCTRRPRWRPTSAPAPTSSSAGSTTPHLYPDKLVDLTDVADYLGKKYGGWYDVRKKYGKRARHDSGSAMPLGASSATPSVYRESHVKAAGFDSFPKDTAGFLKLCQALKAKASRPASRSATRWATATTGRTG